jgi:hypothetical protein
MCCQSIVFEVIWPENFLIALCLQQFELHQSALHCVSERLNELDVVQTHLYSNSGPYNTPALFIEASSVFGFTRGGELDAPTMRLERTNATKTIAEWQFKYPTGRVIFLVDETIFYPSTLELHQGDIGMQTHLFVL